MGWRQFRAWLRECNRAREAEAGRAQTDPDSWDGYENDRWWAERRAQHQQMRGRR